MKANKWNFQNFKGLAVLQQNQKYINLALCYVLEYFPRVSSKSDATGMFCAIKVGTTTRSPS